MDSHPRKILRAMLQGKDIIVAPGAYDGLSACLIEKTGLRLPIKQGPAPLLRLSASPILD